jgi:hypothetical protein
MKLLLFSSHGHGSLLSSGFTVMIKTKMKTSLNQCDISLKQLEFTLPLMLEIKLAELVLMHPLFPCKFECQIASG